MATEIVNRQRLARVDAARVATIADATIEAVGKVNASLTVAFVRDRVIRNLNSTFKGVSRASDVLSFPAQEMRSGAGDDYFGGGGSLEHLGDVVISTDTALRQAGDSGHSFEREVDELVIHGVLHLCGYDHDTDRGQMNRLELKLRRKLLGDA